MATTITPNYKSPNNVISDGRFTAQYLGDDTKPLTSFFGTSQEDIYNQAKSSGINPANLRNWKTYANNAWTPYDTNLGVSQPQTNNAPALTIPDLQMPKTMGDIKSPSNIALPTAPERIDYVKQYQTQRESAGLPALEAQLNTINSDIASLNSQYRQIQQEEKSRGRISAITSAKLARVQQELAPKYEQLQEQQQRIAEQLQTANSTINTLMDLTGKNYQEARSDYEFEYNKAIQMQQLLNTQQDRDTANYKAGLETMTNLLKNSGITNWNELSDVTKVSLQTLETRLGQPGLARIILELGTQNPEISTSIQDDGKGNISIIGYDKNSGNIKYVKQIAGISKVTPEQKLGELTTKQQSIVQNYSTQFTNSPIVKDYNEVLYKKLSMEEILKGGVSGPADLSLVYEFMKALDPTSVVRESEYATAAKSGNIFQGIYAKFNGYLKEKGGILPQNVRSEFTRIIDNKLAVKEKQYNNLRNEYGNQINKQAGITDGSDYLINYNLQVGENDPLGLGFNKPLSMGEKGSAKTIAAAIKQVESGGNYNAKGGSGEFGAYQFMPSTWKGWAKQYLGNSNAPMTKENQDRVAEMKIQELLNQGYDARAIALIWNGGEPIEKKGTNKYGVKYDSGNYAKKVLKALG
jgi:muramidase (phage lysozyme)